MNLQSNNTLFNFSILILRIMAWIVLVISIIAGIIILLDAQEMAKHANGFTPEASGMLETALYFLIIGPSAFAFLHVFVNHVLHTKEIKTILSSKIKENE